MYSRLVGFCCGLAALTAAAQERFGITHSNYAGADAAYLNPARSAGQWPYADFRLTGTDLFVWNSLVAWSQRVQPLIGEVRSGIGGHTSGELMLRGPLSGRTERGFVQATALGPAFSLSLGRGTIGAGVRTRAHASISGASPAMGNFI